MTIMYSNMSYSDLTEIFTYIKDILRNEKAALEIKSGIITEMRKLEDSPYLGSPVLLSSLPEVILYSLRYKNYMIFYKIIEDSVFVDRILRARIDFERLLSN